MARVKITNIPVVFNNLTAVEVLLLPKGVDRSTMNLRESCVVIDCGDKVYIYTGRDILEETIQNEKSCTSLVISFVNATLRNCFPIFNPYMILQTVKYMENKIKDIILKKLTQKKIKKVFFSEFSQWFCRRFKKRQTPEKFLYSSENRQPSAGFSAQYSECKEADFLENTKPTIKN